MESSEPSASTKTGHWRFIAACAAWLIAPPLLFAKHELYDGPDFIFALPELALTLAWLAFPAWAIVVAVRTWRQGALRVAVGAALIPVAALLVVLHGRYVTDVIRFTSQRADLEARLAAARAGSGAGVDAKRYGWIQVGPPMLAYFEWGGFLSTSYGVVYDETGEIMKEPGQRSEPWRSRTVQTQLRCPADVRSLGGNFYAAHITC